MPATNTEILLATWRAGPTLAERLAAAILKLEGYEDIDPQAPIGGPDGRKDILCTKGSRTWIAAVYFPPTGKSFSEVETKFRSDLEGTTLHKRGGLVFITNQRLTLGERDTLAEVAQSAEKECDIYNVERLRAVLDVPEGYGVRAEFLGTTMSPDEQIAYFARSGNQLEAAIERNTTQLRRLSRQIEQLRSGQEYAIHTLAALATGEAQDKADIPPPRLDPLSLENFRAAKGIPPLSANISIALLLAFHRLICIDLPARMIGQLRDRDVYIGPFGRSGAEASFVPVAHAEITARLDALCQNWNDSYERLVASGSAARLEAIANFHHEFQTIHPFEDGNGRAGRAVLMQQCLDLFGRADMSMLDRGPAYYDALKTAGDDGVRKLAKLLTKIVED
jgi:fido (protein-threonine AMPylation protein)